MLIQNYRSPAYSVPRVRSGPELKQFDQVLLEGSWDSVSLSSERFAESKSKVRRDFAVTAALKGGLGLAVGAVLSHGSPITAAVGAGLGMYLAYQETLRKESGTMEVEVDGQVRQTAWYGPDFDYQQAPEEVRLQMMAQGELGEQIAAYSPSPQELPGALPGPELVAHRGPLIELAKSRQLLADFGQQSRYGEPVLNLIEANAAARLLANGDPVYVAQGQAEDRERTFSSSASNSLSHDRSSQHGSFVERTYTYSLSELRSGQDLSQVTADPGQGLPEGFEGLYRDQSSCQQVVARDFQTGVGRVRRERSQTDFQIQRSSKDQALSFGSSRNAQIRIFSSMNLRDPITLLGVAAGLGAATALAPGNPGAFLASAAVGFMAGRELGWLAQSRAPRFSS